MQSKLSRIINAKGANPSATRDLHNQAPVPVKHVVNKTTPYSTEKLLAPSNADIQQAGSVILPTTPVSNVSLSSESLSEKLGRDEKLATEHKAALLAAKRERNKKLKAFKNKYVPEGKRLDDLSINDREEVTMLAEIDLEQAERMKDPAYVALLEAQKAEAEAERLKDTVKREAQDRESYQKVDDLSSKLGRDAKTLTKHLERFKEERLSDVHDVVLDLAMMFGNTNVYCSKSGMSVMKLNHNNDLEKYAMTHGDVDAGQLALAWGFTATTVHPMWLDTSPDNLEKARYVDPVGMFVYLSSKLTGQTQKGRAQSFDSIQTNSAFASKLASVQERGKAYEAINEMILSDISLKTKLLTINEFMLRLLAFTSLERLVRSFWSGKTAVRTDFVSPADAALDLEAFGYWVVESLKKVCKARLDLKDVNELTIENTMRINQGDSSYAYILLQKSRAVKRRRLSQIGFHELVTNSLIDAITEEELEIPSGELMNEVGDEQGKRIYNRMIRKKHGKDTVNSKGRSGKIARKRAKEFAEVSDFMDGMDAIEIGGANA